MFKSFIPAAIILLGQMLCTTAHAAPELSASYEVFLSSGQRTDDQDLWNCGTSGPSTGTCYTTGGAQASVMFDQWNHHASAAATPGTLRARAYAEWPANIIAPRFASAQASLTDILTLTHPDIDASLQNIGTWLRIRFSVDGDLDSTGVGAADFRALFTAQAGSSWIHTARFEAVYDANGLVSAGYGGFEEFAFPEGSTGNPFGIFETYAWMPYNQPINMMWSLGAGAALPPVSYGLAGSAHARLDNTAVFLGMEILEIDGDVLRLVEGARIASASGYNWATPVPLPAAVWLFGSGLLGLIGVARRKARSS